MYIYLMRLTHSIRKGHPHLQTPMIVIKREPRTAQRRRRLSLIINQGDRQPTQILRTGIHHALGSAASPIQKRLNLIPRDARYPSYFTRFPWERHFRILPYPQQ